MITITIEQLIAHAIGDWALESEWMAFEKGHKTFPALLHSAVYTLVFWLWLHPTPDAIAVIACSHFLIDRFRLARFAVYLRNFFAPYTSRVAIETSINNPDGSIHVQQIKMRQHRWWWRWSDCNVTGYQSSVMPWTAFGGLTATDAVMHIACNAAALALLKSPTFSALVWLQRL